MIDPTLTYRKSGAGSEALAQRHPSLTPRLRSLLILVDGKRSCGELGTLGQSLGDTSQLLEQLLDLGFIEAHGQAAAAKPAATEDKPPRVPLAQAQRHAVRKLTDLLGPAAEELCMRIESTRSAQEFGAAIAKAESMLRQFSGAAQAEQFATEMASQRPA